VLDLRQEKIIKSYLNRPDVEMCDDIISAYDLYLLIDYKLQELREIQIPYYFKQKINGNLTPRNVVSKILNLKPTINERKCRDDNNYCENGISIIEVKFEPVKNNGNYDLGKIIKNIDCDKLTVDGCMNLSFVEKHYDVISKIFSVLEEFYELFNNDITEQIKKKDIGIRDDYVKNIEDINICDDNFSVLLRYTNRGFVYKYLEFKDKEYNRGYYSREFFSLHSHPTNEILKKIPVKISELDYTCKTIVENSLNKMNVPILVKRH